MTSTVFQFLVAGALVMAWIWMLGRPLLTTLARRSRRDSVGHFRQQQAAIGRSIAADPTTDRVSWRPGLHPLASWRAQPIERRRLQLLLGSAIAAFGSLLLAIALRGLFVRLFLLMAIAFVGHVLIAAFIGARELRAIEADRADSGPVADRTRSELFQDRDPRFSEGFFEPIPEFESIEPIEPPEPVEATGPIHPSEPVAPAAEADPAPAEPAPAEPSSTGPSSTEPTFTAPPVERARPPRRPKARPIFIESELDEGGGAGRAVND